MPKPLKFIQPTIVYVLFEGTADARLLTPKEISTLFTKYEDTGWEPKLKALYALCGCQTVELVQLPGLGDIWIDEEGLLKGRLPNPIASTIYQNHLVGTAVLVVNPIMEPRIVIEIIGGIQTAFAERKAHSRAHSN